MLRPRAPRSLALASTLLLAASPALAQSTPADRNVLAPAAPAAGATTATPAAPTAPVDTTAPLPVAAANTAATSSTHDPSVAERAAAIRAACRDTRRPDLWSWIAGSTILATGVGLTVATLVTPTANRNPASLFTFMLSIGPGLGLGGLGIPFARGLIKESNPLDTACAHALANWPGHPDDPFDVELAERLLRASGRPDTIILPVLLGLASVGSLAFTIAAFAVNSTELVQVAGGIDAAVITGWFFLPPTPERLAALRFARGEYGPRRPSVVAVPTAYPLPGGMGGGLALAF